MSQRSDAHTTFLLHTLEKGSSAILCLCVHGPIARAHRPPASTRSTGSSGTITLWCKDLKVLQLEVPGLEECLNITSSIEVNSSSLCQGAKGWQEKAATCSV